MTPGFSAKLQALSESIEMALNGSMADMVSALFGEAPIAEHVGFVLMVFPHNTDETPLWITGNTPPSPELAKAVHEVATRIDLLAARAGTVGTA